jgi:magnesium transporter
MQVLDRVDPERIRGLTARDEFFWLDLLAPSDAEIDELAQLLHLPELAVEDDKEFRQRPKVDAYRDQVFVVFYGAGAEGTLAEVHLHITGAFVVTLRRQPCGPLEDAWRTVRDAHAHSELDLVFRIFDALADSLGDVLDEAAARVEQLEERAFSAPDHAVRREIADLRTKLFRVQQVVRPQRDMLGARGDLLEQLPGLEGATERHPFREVHDVLVQASDRIDYLRELLGEALGIYLSSKTNQLNVLATRLAVLGTIFLPLTFATGFFGQNFGWLVDHIRGRDAFLIWTIAPTTTILGVGLLLALLSRRQR